MLLHYGDANSSITAGEFFSYAAIVMRAENAKTVSTAISEARTELSVPDDHVLKFNPGPNGMEHGDCANLKGTLLRRTAAAGALMWRSPRRPARGRSTPRSAAG